MQKFLYILLATSIGATVGCNRDADTRTVETNVRSEADSAGRPIETEVDVAGRVPDGSKVDLKHEEFVGVVTKFTAGESLEIKGADGSTHKFDLHEKDLVATVSPSIKPGARVEVIVDKPEGGTKTISVVPHS
jgi:hypothetical protein